MEAFHYLATFKLTSLQVFIFYICTVQMKKEICGLKQVTK